MTDDPAPTDPCATWTPQAALGLTCTDCHPEYRDDHQEDDSRTRPETFVGTAPDGWGRNGLPWLPDVPVDELPWREEPAAAGATGGRTTESPGQPAATDEVTDRRQPASGAGTVERSRSDAAPGTIAPESARAVAEPAPRVAGTVPRDRRPQ